jgi:threonine dehydrogenase-like Zn-dependent dehydrogenase
MRALRLTAAGEVELVETERPRPRAGQTLVRVGFAGICGTDRELASRGLARPDDLIPGHEIGGTVVETDDPRFGRHDRIVVDSVLHCPGCSRGRALGWPEPHDGELGLDHDGGWAEYVVVDNERCLPLPVDVAASEAPLIEPLVGPVGALLSIREVVAGARVAVLGSGVAALHFCQAARWLEASEVVAYISHPERRDRFTSIGRAEVRPAAEAGLGKDRFDVVVDAVGMPDTFGRSVEAAKAKGFLVWYGLRAETATLSVRRIVLENLNVLGRTNPPAATWEIVLGAIARHELRVDEMVDRVLGPDEVPAVLAGPSGVFKAVIAFDPSTK